MMWRACSMAGFALILAGTAFADYEVTGRFVYLDREFNLDGFTGQLTALPIRFADVEVVDANTQVPLASGATDRDGFFALQVADSQTRDISVRVRTSSMETSDLHLTVRHASNDAVFAVAHPKIDAHAPTDDIDFTATPVVAAPEAGGDAFNIFDVLLDGIDYIADLRGARPGAELGLTAFWPWQGEASIYRAGEQRMFLRGVPEDSDSYDDSVILHELGHFVEFELARSDSPRLEHDIDACEDPRLAWSEGWSTFFQNLVRDWKGLDRPEIYVDTTGHPGIPPLINYEVETPTAVHGMACGSGAELAVNAALWDLFDDDATLDDSHGVDDDAMQVSQGDDRVWDVMSQYMPLATSITVEDFWDGWLARGHGSESAMQSVFEAHDMEFKADTLEPNDSWVEASEVPVDTMTTHTIYPAGDTDWLRYDVEAGMTYVFETTAFSGCRCGMDTRLDLLAADGRTLLRSNDDRAPGNWRSNIEYVAGANGSVFVKISRPPGCATYASFAFLSSIRPVRGIEHFHATSTFRGVFLSWQARDPGRFLHFDIERGDTADGPFARLNTHPIVAVPGTAHFEFLDQSAELGSRYHYQPTGVEVSGTQVVFDPIEATVTPPATAALHMPRPNPFNPSTTIQFDLSQSGRVWLRVYDLRGRLVRTLIQGERLPSCSKSVDWDGLDDDHREAASGVYVVKLEALGVVQNQRAVRVK